MPTRYRISVTAAREVTFDAPDGMPLGDVHELIGAQAENLLKEVYPSYRVLDSFQVTLEAVQKAPARILRVTDAGDAITEEETLWADHPQT